MQTAGKELSGLYSIKDLYKKTTQVFGYFLGKCSRELKRQRRVKVRAAAIQTLVFSFHMMTEKGL